MSVYGIVIAATGLPYEEQQREAGLRPVNTAYLSGSFKAAVEKAEWLGVNCMVVELVPRANIRHERTHRTIIDPLL